MADGGLVSNTFAVIGSSPGTNGQVTVTGADSTWLNTDFLNIGDWGNGTLTIFGGGQVQNTTGYLGQESGATGLATITGNGSRWINSDDLIVGDSGNATLNIENGAMVTSRGGSIGRYGSAIARATVSNIGSTWAMGANLSVGTSGDGALAITGSGTVSNVNGYVARESGSTGEVTVSGTGSTWINSGDLHIGKSGSGNVSITDSGAVQVGGMTQLYANGTVNIDGGTMSVGKTLELDAGSTVNLNSGTLSVTSFNGDGNLAWNGGTLEITAPTGLIVGTSGLLGSLLNIDSDQTLNVTNTTTIESGARITALGGFSSDLLKIESGGQFYAPSGFTNNNEIQLAGGDARITGASLTNGGVISGEGRFVAPINNLPTGEFRSALSERQVFTGAGNENQGSITTTGGQINVTGTSTLRFGGGVINTGNVVMSFASASLFGDVTNTADGLVSLTGDSSAILFGNVANAGSIFVGTGSRAVFAGRTSGDGSFPGGGTVEFGDGFSPGNSPGAVSFGGDVVLGSGSTTVIELGGVTAGAQHDQLVIAGAVNLEGNLDLVPLAPYTDPSARGTSDAFVIITAGARSGTFNTVQYDGSTVATDSGTDGNGSFRNHAGGGLFRSVTYTATTVELQNLLALEGDADGNKNIDITDFNSLASNFDPDGATAPHSWLEGNFNGDDNVDITDFNLLASNFSPDGYSTSAIPEPSTVVLLLLGLDCVMLLCCSRAWRWGR